MSRKMHDMVSEAFGDNQWICFVDQHLNTVTVTTDRHDDDPKFTIIVEGDTEINDLRKLAYHGLRGRINRFIDSILYEEERTRKDKIISVTKSEATEQIRQLAWKQSSDYTGPSAMPGENASGLASDTQICSGELEPIKQETIDYLVRLVMSRNMSNGRQD